MKTESRTDQKTSELERKYQELFDRFRELQESNKRESMWLRQPSQLRVVESVTTYGAYEDPIEEK